MKYDYNLKLQSETTLPVFRLNSSLWRLCNQEKPARDYRELLRNELENSSEEQPIVVMVHGIGFSPESSKSDPHQTLYADQNVSKKWDGQAWPARFQQTNASGSLAIAYGWHAVSSHMVRGANHSEVYDYAGGEASVFAKFLETLQRMAPERSVNIVCHGLGARVVLNAFQHINSSTVDRVLIMDGEEYASQTLLAVRQKSAQSVKFYNATSTANSKDLTWVSDNLNRSGPSDRLIALGFMFERQNWLELPIESAEVLSSVLHFYSSDTHTPVNKNRWSFPTSKQSQTMLNRITYNSPDSEISNLKVKLAHLPKPSHKLKRRMPSILNISHIFAAKTA